MSEQESGTPSGDESEAYTWSDPGGRPGRGDLVRYAQEAQAKHHRSMQALVLWGLGLLFVITLGTVVAAVSLGGISEDFGRELVRIILPTVLGSATTIVGVLFVNARRKGE